MGGSEALWPPTPGHPFAEDADANALSPWGKAWRTAEPGRARDADEADTRPLGVNGGDTIAGRWVVLRCDGS